MNLFNSIQKHTGLARGEAVVVSTITVFLAAGWIGERLFPPSATHDVATVERVIALLDSLSALSTQTQATIQPTTVPQTTKPPTTTPLTTQPQPAAAGRVRVNTASRSLLERLPGVGPAMAERIIEERARQPFESVDDLTRVKGIGPKKLEKMRPYVIAP